MKYWFSLGLTVLLLSITGCITNTTQVGYTFDEQAVKKIVVGKTRKAIVKRTLGSPSSISDFGDETWYYIAAEYESIAFLEPELVNQKVLAITFDNQVVKSVRHYTANDARQIAINPEVTPTEGHDIGVINQLLGNIGRFNTKRDRLGP